MQMWRNWYTHSTQNAAGNHVGSSPTICTNKQRTLGYCLKSLCIGADGGTRTHMVSRSILSAVRIPISPHLHWCRNITINMLVCKVNCFVFYIFFVIFLFYTKLDFDASLSLIYLKFFALCTMLALRILLELACLICFEVLLHLLENQFLRRRFVLFLSFLDICLLALRLLVLFCL